MTGIITPVARNEQRPLYRWRSISTATGLPETGLTVGDFVYERAVNGLAFGTTAVDNGTFAEIAPGLYSIEGTEALPADFEFGLVRGTRAGTTPVEGELVHSGALYRGTVAVSGAALTFPAGYVPRVGDVVTVYRGDASRVNTSQMVASTNGQIATLGAAIPGLLSTEQVLVLPGDLRTGAATQLVNTNVDAPISGVDDAVDAILSDDFGVLALATSVQSLLNGQVGAESLLNRLLNRFDNVSVSRAPNGLSGTLSYANPAGGAPFVINLTFDSEGNTVAAEPA